MSDQRRHRGVTTVPPAPGSVVGGVVRGFARVTAIFSTFFDMTVYPVLDVQEAARIGGEALEFIRSA
jgi:hypothetical protein